MDTPAKIAACKICLLAANMKECKLCAFKAGLTEQQPAPAPRGTKEAE